MRLTRRGEYALRSMVDLASNGNGHLTRSHEVALRQDIPPKFLPQIINDLSRAGLVETVRGAAGGVRLARPASDISVAQIIEVIEGSLALNDCQSPESCERKDTCPLAPVWAQAQGALQGVLAGTTLAQLAQAQVARGN